MRLSIVCLIILVSGQRTVAWDSMKEHEDFLAGKTPFFELPCMRVGGTCAKLNACPTGLRVAQRGLCPEQQRYGIECCRPLKGATECRSRHGECVSKGSKCSPNLVVRDATGCRLKEVCCYRLSIE